MGLHKEFINNLSKNKNDIGRLIPYFLMSSYLYYECNKSVFSDEDFDLLCERLLENFDNVKHMHKHLINKEDLKSGSGYAIKYTNMIKGASLSWYEQEKGKHNG